MQPGTVHDLPGVYRVCLLTGAGGADATTLHDDPDLLGHLWAGPYVAFPDAVTRVLRDEHGVAGYCLARARHPRLRGVGRAGLAPAAAGTASARQRVGPRRCRDVVERLHHPTSADAGLLTAHPAHLHVDLLPRLQGQGWGRRVVDSVLEGLTTAGATGVHLGVDEGNTGAQAFYERLGFTELAGPPGARFYGMPLGSRTL